MKTILALALFGCIAASAQSPARVPPSTPSAADIHIDFTQVLKAYDGSTIMGPDGKTPMTLAWVATLALDTPIQGDPVDWHLIRERDDLCVYIWNNKNAALSSHQVAQIIDRMANVTYGPGHEHLHGAIQGAAIRALDKNAK